MVAAGLKNRERMVLLCHALSDDTRLQILELLAEGEQCVCDLTDALKASQSRLSFHLKTLKDTGLLQDRREGRWVYYALNPETIEELNEMIGILKSRAKLALRNLQRCE